jgi:predicted AlkP superfamily pyrophosphatase or phosphodiesterase
MYFIILFFFATALNFFATAISNNQIVNQILLISFDGLSSVYFEEFLKENPKSNFQSFINEGLRAEFLKPSFPTSTFPNHYTLVTGLYPESHGIIGNDFFDNVYNEMIALQSNSRALDPKWWNSSDPLWLTAKNQVCNY